MRIAYILNTLQVGGAEREVLALAEGLYGRGHRVQLIVLRGAAPQHLHTNLDVLHLNVSRNPLTALCGLQRTVAALREFRPHILHSHQFHGNMLARAVKLALPSIAVVSSIHNVYEGGHVRMLAYRLTDPLAMRTVAVCQAALNRFAEAGAISRRKSSVIVNGIDCTSFTPGAERGSELRARMDAGESFLWLAVGRLTPAKDYPTLLRAFAIVHAAFPHVRLWIAGEGNSAYCAGLQRVCVELGIESAVRWLGVRHDVTALLDAADAFMLSSAWEGMPLALGEAMAMEKPFVASDVGGVGEMAGDCGTLVPAGDAGAFAAAMIALMRSGPEMRRMEGRASRARIVEHFNMEACVDAWECCYAELTKARE